jgi:hypothetical protein
MKRWLLLSLLTVVPLAQALEMPDAAAADAKAQAKQALAAGKKARKPTLPIFGSALVNAHFEGVKIDVGNFDHLDFFAKTAEVPAGH